MAKKATTKKSAARKSGGEAEVKDLRARYAKLEKANRDLNERVLELYTLYNVSRSLSLSLQLTELFDTIIKIISESLSLDEFSIMLVSEDHKTLIVQAAHGMKDKKILEARVPIGKGVVGKIVQTGKPVVVEDISKIDEFFYYDGSGIKKGAYLGVPLLSKGKMPIGVLNAHKPQPNSFGQRDVALFEAVAEHCGIAIENAFSYQRTQELSNRDDLTGLYNRRYFFERFEREIERAQRYDRILALLIADIDLFKEYNDSFGHLAGDEAIKSIALAIEDELRKVDIIARYGGEEFVILLPESDKESAVLVGEKIRKRVEKLKLPTHKQITITVGIACYPIEAQNPLDLLERADKALYYGKAEGRNRVSTRIPADFPAR